MIDYLSSATAARALAEFDLSPADRSAAVRLLMSTIDENGRCEVGSEEIRSVLRAIDCEWVARRTPKQSAAN